MHLDITKNMQTKVYKLAVFSKFLKALFAHNWLDLGHIWSSHQPTDAQFLPKSPVFLQASFSLLLMIKLSCLIFLLRFKYMNLHYQKIPLALKSEQLLRIRGFVSKSFQNS